VIGREGEHINNFSKTREHTRKKKNSHLSSAGKHIYPLKNKLEGQTYLSRKISCVLRRATPPSRINTLINSAVHTRREKKKKREIPLLHTVAEKQERRKYTKRNEKEEKKWI
jgi:hypothetical protein